MAIENGLKPSFRGFKGVGFNRVLPAPFGFGNCWFGDGVNDSFQITECIAESWNDFFTKTYTVELWVKHIGSCLANKNTWAANFDNGGTLRHYTFGTNTYAQSLANGGFTLQTQGFSTVLDDQVGHIIQTSDYNLLRYNTYNLGIKTANEVALSAQTLNPLISNFNIGAINAANQVYTEKLDEFRLYTRIISPNETLLSYNNGAGSGPSDTRDLKLWFNFEKAEIATDLYPSGLPAGWLATDWGIRNLAAQDSWPKKYHAKAINMTNNETLGGALQTW